MQRYLEWQVARGCALCAAHDLLVTALATGGDEDALLRCGRRRNCVTYAYVHALSSAVSCYELAHSRTLQ